MTISSVNLFPSDDEVSSKKQSAYEYDLRLEIGVKETGETVPVVSIFYDLVRRLKGAADEGGPVVVLTATNKLFHENKELSSQEFQKEFQVDNTEGKVSKVLLGFKIRSLTKFSDLKRRLMHTYLMPHNLFLRQHAGGFKHGVKTYSYGFLKDDHPDHPDITKLNQRFGKIINDAWKKLDEVDKAKWRKEIPQDYFNNTGITLPITFTKERLAANHDQKERIVTNALSVATPTKYGKLLKALLDIALSGKKLNNLIPFALSRDNPTGYYYMVAHQARFIENHRNIPIMNVPVDAHLKPGNKGETLEQLLNGHTCVQRVAYEPQQTRFHVSTTAAKYKEVHQWITRMLEENRFPYDPSTRPLKYGTNNGTGTAVSYSDIFKDAISSASDSFAASTIKTTASTAWKTRPPIAISYDWNEAAFPALPSTRPAVVPPTPTTASETYDEGTIQSAISVAIKKLEEQYQAELQKLKQEMQKQIDEVTTQMKELGQQVATQTYQALVKEESPLVTKTDHAKLQHEINLISTQLTTIIGMFKQGSTPTESPTNITPGSPARFVKRQKPNRTPEKHSDPSTQDHSVSSATSTSDEGMEGCEE